MSQSETLRTESGVRFFTTPNTFLPDALASLVIRLLGGQRVTVSGMSMLLIDIRLLLVCKFTGIVQSETPPVLPTTAFSKFIKQNFTLEPCLFTFGDSQSIYIYI